jgi:hypothetical protein
MLGCSVRKLTPYPEFKNFSSHIDDIECIPNLPNLKNILSNITLMPPLLITMNLIEIGKWAQNIGHYVSVDIMS